MPKRAFPFSSCTPLQLKTHVENKHVNNNEAYKQQVYAKTQSLLKAGAKAYPKKNDNFLASVCLNCNEKVEAASLLTCSFCERRVCAYCYNACFNCEQIFCVLCSVVSYDKPEENSYCLSCCGS